MGRRPPYCRNGCSEASAPPRAAYLSEWSKMPLSAGRRDPRRRVSFIRALLGRRPAPGDGARAWNALSRLLPGASLQRPLGRAGSRESRQLTHHQHGLPGLGHWGRLQKSGSRFSTGWRVRRTHIRLKAAGYRKRAGATHVGRAMVERALA